MAGFIGSKTRPLSPHLQIYRWTGTMAMAVAHRVAGVGLSVGLALLVWWLIAAASGPVALVTVNRFLGSWIGTALMIVMSWALFHHALGGIRHFIWDSGHGFGRTRNLLAWGSLCASVLLTAILWLTILFMVSK